MKFIELKIIISTLIVFIECLPEKCIHIEYNYSKPVTEVSDDINHHCNENVLCRRTYNITKVSFSPYSDEDIITPRLKACCGFCPNKTNVNSKENKLDNYESALNMDDVDFYLPVLGSLTKRTSYGYYFIPVISAPDYFYITKALDPVFDRLMKSISKALPLVIICLLMAVLSGFITWSIETWNNREEFPRHFLIGWFEGFWWSFISMTTVGYGDKTPKSVPGRLFAILWILIGITLFGILTGLLTSSILYVNDPTPPMMKGARVGVLNRRARDESLVSRNDGIIVKSQVPSFFGDIFELLKMLENNQIDGFVLDKIVYRSVKFILAKKISLLPEFLQNRIHFFVNGTRLTSKTYPEENQAYGVLVKDEKVYNYFHDAIASNRIFYDIQITEKNQELITKPPKIDILSFSNMTFKHAVMVMCTAFALILIVGLIIKLVRAARCYRGRSTSPVVEENNSSVPYTLS